MLKQLKTFRDCYKYDNLPRLYWIDVSSVCNLRCVMCPQHNGLKRKTGQMSFELYKKILDEISINRPQIKLFMSGEPLLNKDIFEMIEYAHQKKCETVLHTNATLLTETVARKILYSNLDKISFSFDGCTPEIYESIRINAKYDSVKKNIKRFLELKKELKKNRLKTQIEIIRMNETEKFLSEFVKEWKDSGVDKVGVVNYMTWLDEVKDSRTKKPKTYGYVPCYSPFHSASILSDGTVVPCCLDLHGDMPLGNMNTQTFKEIWLGKPYLQLRQQLLENKIPKNSICNGCYNTSIGSYKDLAVQKALKTIGRHRHIRKKLEKDLSV